MRTEIVRHHMHDAARTRWAKTLSGIVIEDFFINRTFASYANTVRPVLETIQRRTQLVKNKIAFESEHGIELMYRETIVIEDLV
jgi:hypothetical protein